MRVIVASLRVCSMLISQGVSISLRGGAGCYRDSSASLLPPSHAVRPQALSLSQTVKQTVYPARNTLSLSH